MGISEGEDGMAGTKAPKGEKPRRGRRGWEERGARLRTRRCPWGAFCGICWRSDTVLSL